MRVHAATLLALWLCLYARAHTNTHDGLQRTLQSLLGNQYKPIQRLYSCAQTLGVTKCLNALSVWRAERALNSFSSHETSYNLTEDVERFPWMKYSNESEDELYSKLCDGTERLLQRRSLVLDVIPGYELQLESKGNGTMNVDILESSATGRGKKKKLQKMFYSVLPLLALPGLIMAAILPFLLPGLKMMTLAAGMLNNMALTGAVFTLLRNNAFNDKYEHKVVYVNEGYSNEKHVRDEHFATKPEEHYHIDHEGLMYSDDSVHPFGEDFDSINDGPLVPDLAWIPPGRAILRSHTIKPQGFAKN